MERLTFKVAAIIVVPFIAIIILEGTISLGLLVGDAETLALVLRRTQEPISFRSCFFLKGVLLNKTVSTQPTWISQEHSGMW